MTRKSKRGRLIVIEGNDASGKGTQVRILVKALRRKGFPVRVFDFPRYETETGRKVAAYLRGDVCGLTAYEIAKLYADDRLAACCEIKEALKKGVIVICNRYVPSNLLYQLARLHEDRERKNFARWLESLEYGVNAMPKEDLVIFLYVPVEIALSLLAKKEKRAYLKGEAKDINEQKAGFLRDVEAEYLAFSERSDWKKIDCANGNGIHKEDVISRKVWRAVLPLLG